MATTLTIRDQCLAPGGDEHIFKMEFPKESITVRELIRERVYQEVQDYNRALQSTSISRKFRGLIQPGKTEAALNGERNPQRREIDWNKQFELATDAFVRHLMLVLVGDRQAESLEEKIEIKRGTEVTFLRLVMLVGG